MKYKANIMLVWEASSEASAALTLEDAIEILQAAVGYYGVQIIADEKPVPEVADA